MKYKYLIYIFIILCLSSFIYAGDYDILNLNMTTNSTPSPLVVNCSSQNGGANQCFQAFDGRVNDGVNYWQSAFDTGWDTIDLGVNNVSRITKYSLCTYNSANYRPSTWYIKVSNTSSSNTGIIIDSENVAPPVGACTTYIITNGSQNYYGRYIDIDITASTGGGTVLVDELLLYRNSSVSPTSIMFNSPSDTASSIKYSPNNTLNVNVTVNMSGLTHNILRYYPFSNGQCVDADGFQVVDAGSNSSYFWNITDAINIHEGKMICYNVIASNISNTIYSNNITNINFTYAKLNFSATNSSGSPISSFTVVVNSTPYSTTNGSVYINISLYQNYSLLFNASNISNVYSSIIPTVGYTAFNFSSVQPYAIIFITVYKEATNTLITDNVTITLTDLTTPNILTTNTVTGNATFQNLGVNGDLYEVKLYSANYSSSRYYNFILNSIYTSINAYLIPINLTQNMTICYYNQNGVLINGLHVYQYVLTNTSYVDVQEVYTDSLGRAYLSYNPINYYLLNHSSTLYNYYYYILNPPHNSIILSDGCNYDISIIQSVLSYNYSSLNVSSYAYFNNVTNILYYGYVSYLIGSNSYAMTTSFPERNGTGLFVCMNTSSLTTMNYLCNMSGYTGNVYVEGLVNSTYNFYGGYVLITPSPYFGNIISSSDTAYIVGFIYIVILCGGLVFGSLTGLGVGVIALIIVSWLKFLTPLTFTYIVLDIIVTMIIALELRRY